MTKIEWTDESWNVLTGCTRVSEGCRNCYAERMSARLAAMGQDKYTGIAIHGDGETGGDSRPRWTGIVRFNSAELERPLRWRKPRMIFVNSMSDTFHESVTDGQILRMFEAMGRRPQHIFQILTKRPERAAEWFRRWGDLSGEPREPQLVQGPSETRAAHPSPRGQMFAEYLETLGDEPPPGCAWPTFDWQQGMRWWPRSIWNTSHIWLGTSVEDQATADERHEYLRQCPAAVRFYSVEPLLAPIERLPLDGISWVIAGGESGPGARPCDISWLTSVRDQCKAAGVPFFLKQMGSNSIWRERVQRGRNLRVTERRRPFKDRKGGDPSEWPEDLRVREWPSA